MRRWILAFALGLLVFAGAVMVGERRGATSTADALRAPSTPTATSTPSETVMAAGEHAGGHAGHGGAEPGSVDWSRVTGRDLDVASVFITARDAGVRPALDRLRELAAQDPQLFRQGHVVAHALGRFAATHGGYDPTVYAQCREDFQAGCYHGVLEAYFTSPRAAPDSAVAPRVLDALCPAIVAPGPARLPRLECAHGMGHGLTARARNDYGRALRGCDALSDGEARAECHDGVFMEVAVQGISPPGGTTNGAPLLRRDDLRYPCDSVAAGYQPSCWKYQPMIAYEFTNDLARTLRLCDRAPAASIASCYHGVGKQALGWVTGAPAVAGVCARSSVPERVDACLAGAAESYIDESWTADGALALCRAAPDAGKAACYGTIGTRMALIRATTELVARDCAPAEPAYVEVCVQGARRRGA